MHNSNDHKMEKKQTKRGLIPPLSIWSIRQDSVYTKEYESTCRGSFRDVLSYYHHVTQHNTHPLGQKERGRGDRRMACTLGLGVKGTSGIQFGQSK